MPALYAYLSIVMQMEQDIKDYLSIISELKQVYQHFSFDHSDLNQIITVKYYQWVLNELESVLTKSPITSSDIVIFFQQHWEVVKFSLVAPTCIPQSEVIKLLCRIATNASTPDTPPVSLMFPHVMWQGVTDEIVNLDQQQDLNHILRNHILSDDGKTLIPIHYIAKAEITSHDYQEGRVKLYNPYYQTEDYQYQQISSSEFYRLCHHSQQTSDFSQSIEKYAELLKNKTDLYTHLIALCRSLRINDAHVGVGRNEIAGEGLFFSLLLFHDFYSQLHSEDKQKIPYSLKNSIDLLMQVSSEPHIQALINFSDLHFVQLSEQVTNPALYKHATVYNYTEIYFSGSEIRQLEKAISSRYLKSLIKPINMVQHIESCAGLRREQIESNMQGHESLLMTIGLQTTEVNKQKHHAFSQIKSQQESLIMDIEKNAYTGCDHWSITSSVIHFFNLKSYFEIYRSEQLHIFRSMQPKEIDLILHEYKELRVQLIRIFHDNWVWISFCLDTPENQIDSILNHIASGMRLGSKQLQEILFSIPQTKYKIIMKHFMHLFFYSEFARYQPVPIDVLTKSMLELSLEHLLTYLLKPGVLGALHIEDYVEVISQKISAESDILMKSDFYKIISVPVLCKSLLSVLSPDILSELTSRYLGIGEVNICKESFSILVWHILKANHPQNILNLSKLVAADQLLSMMKHFDKNLVVPYLTAISNINNPLYLFEIIRIVKVLKSSELNKYEFDTQIEKMCMSYPLEHLNMLKAKEFHLLFYKIETIPAIRRLFTRISLTSKCPTAIRYLLDLYYLENNFQHLDKAQTYLIGMLIRNLMCNLEYFDSEERELIFSHEVTFIIIKQFFKFDVPVFIQNLTPLELRSLIKKENNFYIKDITPILASYLQSVDEQKLIDILYYRTKQSSKLIDVLTPDSFVPIVVKRLSQNKSLIYQYWWVLENNIIGQHLSTIIQPNDISQLMDFLYSYKESHVGIVEALLKYLSSLASPLYDDLLVHLLIKPYGYQETWMSVISINAYKYSSKIEDLKKRLELISNPSLFRYFIELYHQNSHLCSSTTILALLKNVDSSIYDDFSFEHFQNLLFLCTRITELAHKLPKLTSSQLEVFSTQPIQIYLDKKNSLPYEQQHVLLMQVVEHLILKIKLFSRREDSAAFLHETFFKTRLGMWMQINCPQYLQTMLEVCSFEELIMNLKMINIQYYKAYFLPYLWIFYPQRMIEGLGLLEEKYSIVHHITQDPSGFFKTIYDLYQSHQSQIVKIFTHHLSHEYGISFFEQYYDYDNEIFFYHLLRDIEVPRAFFNLLKTLLKNTGRYMLSKESFKELMVKRFSYFITTHPKHYKCFFEFHHTESAFDFVAWMRFLPISLRQLLIEQKVLPLDELFFQTYVPDNPKSHCYLFYLSQHCPEITNQLFQLLSNHKSMYNYSNRNLISYFLVNQDIFEFLKCFPSMSPILIDYILLNNVDELTIILQQKILKNQYVVNFLIQNSPLLLGKCMSDYSQITLKPLKQVTNGFLSMTHIETFNEDHQKFLNVLTRQFLTYREKTDYLTQLNRAKNVKPVNHEFVTNLYLLFIKSQFEECKHLFSQRYPIKTILLYEMILAYLSKPHIHEALVEIVATVQRLLQDSNPSIGVLKFKKAFTFFGSEEHYKLEIQQKLIETHHLLDFYKTICP
jgi:hypothetical protein